MQIKASPSNSLEDTISKITRANGLEVYGSSGTVHVFQEQSPKFKSHSIGKNKQISYHGFGQL
jgi:hypothetical protein